MTNTYDIDCELEYQVCSPSVFLFKIQAAHVPGQTILREQLTLSQPLAIDEHTDLLGNRSLRMTSEGGLLTIRYRASVSVDPVPHPRRTPTPQDSVEQLPMDVLPFTVGSRYIESELLFFDALQHIGSSGSTQERVQRIRDWVQDNIRYQPGTSQLHGTARDILSSRTGVCRDLAHLGIAFCRALNIPARFVVGHVQWQTPPPDFHALFEAWIDGRWVLFDPTGMADPAAVVRIGTGLDASQVPFATIFGQAPMLRMSPLVFPSQHDRRQAA